MAMDGAMQVLVLIVAVFGVPKLMAILPDFDPLLLIVGIFIALAALQQLGFSISGPEGDERPKRPQRSSANASSGQEASSADGSELLKDAERALEHNNYARAQELAQKVADADPENCRAWEVLATAQKWQGKRKEALATVRNARDLYEVDSAGLRELAKDLDRSHSPAAAATENEAKGEEFLTKRQYDLAAECFAQAMEVLGEPGEGEDEHRPLRLRVLRRQAECSQQLQDWGTCRRAATAVLEADPNDKQALLMRAAANEALEKFKAALDDARKLLSLDPRHT
eukprot:CAMPEP_0195133524 /NCGR_PEP_ID=MMETSP0448-20130528/148943_1 /TAXON_ID=66468 /ORGANISM="Heterocapsa triquestra, Strain CCMP 448" /LENGTH=283 /DNA_ID=CAMNT_0040171573 /DNA_START=20 /DNA_END=867 /DNA_ORIENTATION=+